jgi:hypothetical protein
MRRRDYPSSLSSKTMVRDFFEDFRVDMWGNVCSNHEFCYNESLAKFDVDHLNIGGAEEGALDKEILQVYIMRQNGYIRTIN